DPGEKMAQNDHADNGADADGKKDGEGFGVERLEPRDRLDHDKLVVPEEEEDKAAGDAGNDHAGHRNDTAEEEVKDIVVLRSGLEQGHPHGDGCPDEKGEDGPGRPAFHLFPYEINRGEDETEK